MISIQLIYNKFEKISAIIALLLISAGILLIPFLQSGYSVSIYNTIPSWMKIVGLATIIASIIFVIYFLYHKNPTKASMATFPLLAVFFLIIISPPLLGYVVSYGDAMSHLGSVKDVIYSGEIPDTVYPAFHILGAQLSLLSNLTPRNTLVMMTVARVFMTFLTYIILARTLNIPSAAVLMVAVSIPMQTSVPAIYAYSSIFLLQLYGVLKIFLGRKYDGAFRRKYVLILTTLFLSSWIYHVVQAGIMVGILLGISLLYIISNVSGVSIVSSFNNYLAMNSARLLAILLLTGFLWSVSVGLLRRAVSIGLSLLVRGQTDQYQGSGSIINKLFNQLDFGLASVAKLGIMRYGDYGILLLIATIGIVFSIFSHKYIYEWTSYKLQITLPIMVLVPGAAIWSIEEFIIGTVPSISFLRALRPGLFVAPVAAGVGVVVLVALARHLSDKPTIASILLFGIIILLVASTVIAGMNIYPRESTVEKNSWTLPSDSTGMDWYFENKNRDIGTAPLWRANDRWMDLLMRPPERNSRIEELNYSVSDTGLYRAPHHFGYMNNTWFGQSIECRYYIESSFGRATHTQTYSSLNRFNKKDFRKLQSDPTTKQIYTNGNMNISKVGC